MIAMPRGWSLRVAFLLILIATAAPRLAAALETSARQAVLFDLTTDTVLFEKAADERMPTASLSKMMTAYLVFEAIKDGRISRDQTLEASVRAWKTGGSRMFLEPKDRVTVDELLRGLVVQAANDAAVVLAEGVSGSERRFVEEMNRTAARLGMRNSRFANASGMPDPEHFSTARDLTIAASALMRRHPEYLAYFEERSFTYGGIRQASRNPLLYRAEADAHGLSTGYTEAGGYGIAGSLLRDGRRLLVVANGFPTKAARAKESWRLLQWGFKRFDPYVLFRAGETVELAPTWLGVEEQVPLVLDQDLTISLSAEQRRALEVRIAFEAPLPAPTAKGTEVGKLTISVPGSAPRTASLKVGKDVAELEPFERALTLGGALAGDFLFGSFE